MQPDARVDRGAADRTLQGRRTVKTARFGAGPRVSGSLVSMDGAPIAGATICVGLQESSDESVRAVSEVTTDARGRFEYRLGGGTSRRVWFVHRAGAAASSANVDVRVRAPVSMRATPRSLRNGEATRFRGRLGQATGADGLIVELQYPQRGRWQTFATVRVRPGGRFRYRYRFVRTFGSRTYRLRARVPAQRGYPFATGASPTVRVRVSG